MGKKLSVSVTGSEYEELDSASKISGVSKGGLLKIAYFGRNNVVVKRRPPADRVELARIAGLLGKAGSNINQVAHAINAGKVPPSAELVKGITETKEGIEEIGTLIREALGGKA